MVCGRFSAATASGAALLLAPDASRPTPKTSKIAHMAVRPYRSRTWRSCSSPLTKWLGCDSLGLCDGLRGVFGMALGRQGERQSELMVTWREIPRSPGHVFYDRLQQVLIGAGFDAFAETACKPYYAAKMGAPSIPPGRYFRMHSRHAAPYDVITAELLDDAPHRTVDNAAHIPGPTVKRASGWPRSGCMISGSRPVRRASRIFKSIM